MYLKPLHVLLKALVCIQQVSGRVVARDDNSVANVADASQDEACSLSAERLNIAARDGEVDLDDDCDEMLNELSESDNGIDEVDLEKLKSGDYTDIVCELMLLSVMAKFKNHIKPGLGRRDEASNSDCQRAREIVLEAETQIELPDMASPENGRALAEVFWVRIDNIDGENPGDLHGIITATDDTGKQVIYGKERSDYESIKAGERAFLTGPARSISAAGGFDLDLNLSDADADASPDDEVSYGKITWKHGDAHDKVQETQISGEYGAATVNYVVMSRAAQAEIEVILINGDKEKPADIYGTITASTKFGERQLFNKASNEYIDIAPGQKIPLTRSTMAVPMDGNLAFNVDVWDHDSDWSPNDEVAKGNIELIPEIATSTKRLVNGEYGQVEIRVSWS